MKILITGANSYIGENLMKGIKTNTSHQVDQIGLIEHSWRQQSFFGFDVIFHVAGIAHRSRGKKKLDLYIKVNRDLAIEVADKAKKDGVKQFIFMSSITIFGPDMSIGEDKYINIESYNPYDSYSLSKLEADIYIQSLNSSTFKTAIIRTPMVYGPNCKGNFPKLIKISKYLFFGLKISNKRSMIYIGNLINFIIELIQNQLSGVFYPQNNEYVSTSELIKISRQYFNQSYFEIPFPVFMIKFFSIFLPVLKKLYGNLAIPLEHSKYNFNYNATNFFDSIIYSISEDIN